MAGLAATVSALEPPIEIVGKRRRAYGAQFRAHMVAASGRPGACLRELARQQGICVSLIYRWRRSAPAGEPAIRDQRGSGAQADPSGGASGVTMQVGTLDPLAAAGEGAPQDAQPIVVCPAMDEHAGMIEIDLTHGTRPQADAFVRGRAQRRALAKYRSRTLGRSVWGWWRPVPGHQLIDAILWPAIHQPGEQVGDIAERIDAVQLASLNQRRPAGPVDPTFVATREQAIFPAQDYRADGTFDGVGVCALTRCTVLPGGNPGRQTLAPAGSTRGGSGGDEWSEALRETVPLGDQRTVRAAT